MVEILDQMNRTIRLASKPRRIVSLVPSLTHLLHHLGLNEEVVGITKFCIYPEDWYRSKMRIGGTKQIDREKFTELHADLVFANKEENTREDIEWLEELNTVYISDVNSVEDAYQMILDVGALVGKDEEAKVLVGAIRESWSDLHRIFSNWKAIYLIWKDPYYAVGRETYIHDVLSFLGFENVCQFNRYPEVKSGEYEPEVVLMSTEPFPFTELHKEAVATLFPNSKLVLVSGEAFSWYGAYMLDAKKHMIGLFKELSG